MQMGTLQSATPPAIPPERDLTTLLHLLALVADAAAAKERIEQLQAAAVEARQAIADAQAAQSGLASARAEHELALKAERTKHEERLAAIQLAFDQECNNRRQAILGREQEIVRLQEIAQRDADQAARLKADLEARLARLKAAAA